MGIPSSSFLPRRGHFVTSEASCMRPKRIHPGWHRWRASVASGKLPDHPCPRLPSLPSQPRPASNLHPLPNLQGTSRATKTCTEVCALQVAWKGTSVCCPNATGQEEEQSNEISCRKGPHGQRSKSCESVAECCSGSRQHRGPVAGL